MKRANILGLCALLAACSDGSKAMDGIGAPPASGGNQPGGGGGALPGGTPGPAGGGMAVAPSMLPGGGSPDDEPPPVPVASLDFSRCPPSAPAVGSACDMRGLYCTYGDSVRADCRSKVTCDGTRWTAAASCQQPPGGHCPAAPGAGACTPLRVGSFDGSATCVYPGGVMCVCKECPNKLCDRGPGWECASPPATGGCPMVIPNVGEPCTVQGTTCSYGDPCGGGDARICRLGTWFPVSPMCSD